MEIKRNEAEYHGHRKLILTNEVAMVINNSFIISPEEYYHLQGELEALTVVLQSDPVASYRITMEQTTRSKFRKISQLKVSMTKQVCLTAFISLKEGCFPSELNERQARTLMGIEKPTLNARGKVDTRWALDSISKELGLEWEELVGRIENIARIKKRMNELKVKLSEAVIDK